MYKFKLEGNYYNGKFNKYDKSSHYSVCNIVKSAPYDENLKLWSLDIFHDNLDQIIESSVSGFNYWKKISIEDRINYLKKYQKILTDRKEDIATTISFETGKPYWEALTEASALIAKVDTTINDSLPRIKNQTIENIAENTTGYITHFPIGPSLIIGPFNFPCHLANTQILASLITGNSIIFKPSEKTSLSGQLLIECFHKAEFPKGVINLIQGTGKTVKELLKYKEIKGVFFTGSKEVGLQILDSTYRDLSKQVSLELGGKNSSIIDETVNIDDILDELKTACFLTAGQRCTSTAFLFVHKSKCDEIIEKFHKTAKNITIGSPFDEGKPFMGPLIDKKSMDNYLLFMGMAKRENIEEVMRGKALQKETQGNFVTPSIHFAKTYNDKSHFLSNEIFGPNCTIIPYDNIEEAVSMVNKSEYGLASSIFTTNELRFKYALENIETGLVNWNRSTCGASAKLPFGGIKNSGNYHPAAVSTIDYTMYAKSSLAKKI